MSLYLGIDQSLTSTGVAVLAPGENLPRALFNISPGELRDGARLAFIRAQLSACLDKHAITQAALEGYAYAATGKVFELGEVGGVLKCLLAERSIPHVVVAPVLLKKFVCNFVGADKDDMRAAVLKKWQIDIAQNDQCDAYGLAKVAQVYSGHLSGYREELEVVKSLKTVKTTHLAVKRGRPRRSL